MEQDSGQAPGRKVRFEDIGWGIPGPGSRTIRKWSARTMSQVQGTIEGVGDEGTRGPIRVDASFCVKREFYESLEEPAGRERLVIDRGRRGLLGASRKNNS